VASFAQLTVKPNGSSDSYVYVKDQVLFVNDYVNLTENPTLATKASIYLRNESQLLQGSPASPTANSGNGYISVFQDSNSDSYDYNYWGSPVGDPLLTGNKNFGILKFYDPDPVIVTKSTQTLVTAGYNGAPSPNLTISNRWLYSFPAGGPWSRIYSGNNVEPGYGFTMKGVGISPNGGPETMNQRYDFRGRPNSGDITVNIKADVETMAGNPYPSAIDMIKFFNDPDNIEINKIAYWDEDRTINSHYYIDNKGGYGTWVPGTMLYDINDDTHTGISTQATFYNYDSAGNQGTATGGMGQDVDRRFAPIGQGFMLIGESGVVGTQQVKFKNDHRRYIKEGNNSDFLRPGRNGNEASFTADIKIDPDTNTNDQDTETETGGNGDNNTDTNDNEESGDSATSQMSYIRIYTTFHTFSGEPSHFRDMVLSFSDDATDGYDRGFDAYHPEDGANSDAFFPIWDKSFVPQMSSKNLVIQGTNFEISKHIPINFTIGNTYKTMIQVVEEINFTTPVYIYDSQSGLYQKISQGNYGGLFNLEPGNYENRFYIVFQDGTQNKGKQEIKNIQEEVTNAVDFFQNNYMQQLEVMNPKGYTIDSANIFDMSGKLVISKSHLGNNTSYNFDTRSLSDGIYIVKLRTNENIGIDYKMKVYNKR